MQQPQIILLKDGTDTSQGIPQLVSNINACSAVADVVRTTLGPRGMDKLVYRGQEVGLLAPAAAAPPRRAAHTGCVTAQATVSNDGASIMRLLDVVHPAARTMVDIAQSQDAEVGDGTTTVVLVASEILKQVKPLVQDGIHPQMIVKVRLAC